MFVFEMLFPGIIFLCLDALFVFISLAVAGIDSGRNSVENALKFAGLNFLIAFISGYLLDIFLASAIIYFFMRIYFLKSVYSLSLDELITVGIYSTVIMFLIAFFIWLR